MHVAPRVASAWLSKEGRCDGGLKMMDRLVRAVDFERVLRTPVCTRSLHFAVHHLASEPNPSRCPTVFPKNLCTVGAPLSVESVDKTAAASVWWLGMVVPKRHARRSVTRSLMKRQVRLAFAARFMELAKGMWVIRLRAPFDKSVFVSAASDKLRYATRDELETLMLRAACRAHTG